MKNKPKIYWEYDEESKQYIKKQVADNKFLTEYFKWAKYFKTHPDILFGVKLKWYQRLWIKIRKI